MTLRRQFRDCHSSTRLHFLCEPVHTGNVNRVSCWNRSVSGGRILLSTKQRSLSKAELPREERTNDKPEIRKAQLHQSSDRHRAGFSNVNRYRLRNIERELLSQSIRWQECTDGPSVRELGGSAPEGHQPLPPRRLHRGRRHPCRRSERRHVNGDPSSARRPRGRSPRDQNERQRKFSDQPG